METNIKKNHRKELKELEVTLKEIGLSNLGMFQINPRDKILKGFKSLLLIGPDEPHFWEKFKKSYEYKCVSKDPLDHWSKNKITELAKDVGARPFFPFQENPVFPFYSWALISKRIWTSPVNLLVHAERGLMVSFRGALAFKQNLVDDIIPTKRYTNPCIRCIAPCLSSCPVGALTAKKYDVGKCQAYVKSPAGSSCKDGCLVRRSCPVGKDFRQKEQSSFHMRAFLR